MERNAKILLAGNDGLIVTALRQYLTQAGFQNVITGPSDLTDQKEVNEFFTAVKPDYVFLTSARVGGILANRTYPAEFIYHNLQAQTNVIHSAWQSGVKKLLFFGSSCVYPKDCPQPMREEYLLSGKLEPTSEPYALAKLTGINMCQSYHRQYGTNFISIIPADLYGPGDDFNPETGHVLPALIAKMHQAKNSNKREVAIWGTGTPKRECLYVDDLADACVFLMEKYDEPNVINVGSGEEISIKELASLIRDIVGFEGEINFDTAKPDGALRKLLDSAKLKGMGWIARTDLKKGIEQTYHWYQSQVEVYR